MQLQLLRVIATLSFFIRTCLTIPLLSDDSNLLPISQRRTITNSNQTAAGTAASPASQPAACPSQKPIAENLCTSGSPYCCSGSGASQVCGPRSTTDCETTTICCINTNGMQICAGEIDFTGPVTININLNL